ncbi:MAG: phospho-sugar mutase, partial [Ruminococcaceae bacterium]|nr:phospho-sugar mutase [Oscillospiraceae bacterium]
GTYTRDKDAVVASLLIAEAAAFYRSKGQSLLDALKTLYQKYGAYQEGLQSVTMEGMEGLAKIKEITRNLRETSPTEINGVSVVAKEDYLESVRIDQNGTSQIDLPKSDVLRFELEDGSSFVVRPSGTEPKIKLYFAVIGKEEEEATEKLNKFQTNVVNTVLK